MKKNKKNKQKSRFDVETPNRISFKNLPDTTSPTGRFVDLTDGIYFVYKNL